MAEKDKEKIFKEGMEVPANIEDMKTAPAPAPAPAPSDRGVFTIEKIGKVKTPKGEKLPRDLMPKDLPPVKKAKGGSASSRADGCCARGKTRGKMVMMGG